MTEAAGKAQNKFDFFEQTINLLEEAAEQNKVPLESSIVKDYQKMGELVQEFNRIYKTQADSIRELEIEQKLLELIDKEKELNTLNQKFDKLKYLSNIGDELIWQNYKKVIQFVNDTDEQNLKFDENNKDLLNRLKFKLLQ